MNLLDLPPHIADLARGLVGRDYGGIRSGYLTAVSDAMLTYLLGDESITKFRNSYKRAVLEYFDVAYFTGYIDGGGQVAQMSDEDRNWFLAKQSAELGYVDMLFQGLKALRKSQDTTQQNWIGIAMQHAQGYTRALDSVYSEGYMRGGREEAGTWHLGGTFEHCSTCSMLNGQTHSLDWFVSRGYIPQQPGSTILECGGWMCECVILDYDGVQLLPPV